MNRTKNILDVANCNSIFLATYIWSMLFSLHRLESFNTVNKKHTLSIFWMKICFQQEDTPRVTF